MDNLPPFDHPNLLVQILGAGQITLMPATTDNITRSVGIEVQTGALQHL